MAWATLDMGRGIRENAEYILKKSPAIGYKPAFGRVVDPAWLFNARFVHSIASENEQETIVYAPRNPAYKALPWEQVEGAQFVENDYVVVDEAGEVIAETYSLRKGEDLARLASKGMRYEEALKRIIDSLGALEAGRGHGAIVAGVSAARAIAEMSIRAPATIAVQSALRMPMSAEFRGTRVELLLVPRGEVVDWDFEDPADKNLGAGEVLSQSEIDDLQKQADRHMAAFQAYLVAHGVGNTEGIHHYGAFLTKVAMELQEEARAPAP